MTVCVHRLTVAFAFSITYFLITGCAPSSSGFRTWVGHADKKLAAVRPRGKSITLLPALTKVGLDTSKVFSELSQEQFLEEKTGRFTVQHHDEFEARFLDRGDSASLAEFYRRLYAGDGKSLRKDRKGWSAMGTTHLLIIRRLGGARIRTFDGAEKLRLELEAELWDVEESEMVWQAATSGLESSDSVSDSAFAVRGLGEMLRHLPVFQGTREMKSW